MAVIEGGSIIEGARRPTFTNAGAPTTATKAGAARVGDLLVDSTNGKLYIATATDGATTVTWTVVGAQVA